MKKLIILLSLILLSSCGSYQLSTVGYTPIRETRVITPVYTTPWYYGLTDPSWRWHYYQRYNTPRVIIVKQKPVVRVRGVRGSAGRSNATRSTSTRRSNSNRKN
jgi:hypothetical protein